MLSGSRQHLRLHTVHGGCRMEPSLWVKGGRGFAKESDLKYQALSVSTYWLQMHGEHT